MPWAEIDGGDWLLPAARNKTKLDLLRPLSAAALSVLNAEPRTQPFVFSNDGGATALRGFDSLKAAFDRAMAKPITPYRIHDLRRTARSLMSRAGVPSDHAERVLGHVIGGVRAVYDRHDFHEEKAAALAALSRTIDRIVQGKPTLVRLERVPHPA
jgi:integrase